MMIFTALFAILLSHPGSGAIVQAATPEETINQALGSINKYNSDNNYQNLRFYDYNTESVFYDLTSSNLQLGDLSTIQLKPNTQPSIDSTVSTLGTTHHYNATFELKNGLAQYDYLLKFLFIFWSSGTVTATASHSFQVGGTVNINTVKQCKADVSTISVKLGHFQTSIKPGGIMHFIVTPFIRYLTNSHSEHFFPLEARIAGYIQDSIPQSKFSDLVCSVFNK